MIAMTIDGYDSVQKYISMHIYLLAHMYGQNILNENTCNVSSINQSRLGLLSGEYVLFSDI